MKKLFEEFSSVGIDQWIEKIQTDLKGKSDDLLKHSPESDLKFDSYYHRSHAETGSFPTGKSNNAWVNRKVYNQVTNKLILSDLNEGINGISLKVNDQSQFDELTEEVGFEYISTDVSFNDALVAKSFIGHQSIDLNFDVIERATSSGGFKFDLNEYVDFFKVQDQHNTVWISGCVYGNGGASAVQELAFTANHLNEYVHALTSAGISLEEINKKLIVELSVTDDYFTNIAKFKLIRYFVGLVFKGYQDDYKLQPFKVYAKTSRRYLAQNDHNNNLLRQTTMAMSAILGGCDAIQIDTLTTGDWDKDQIMERMAKNIPLVLQEESYLDKVSDPAEGSYYVEEVCQQLAKAALELFKEVENEGGLKASLENNKIQLRVAENRESIVQNINDEKNTFLGVNKFPSTLEDWKDTSANSSDAMSDFSALNEFRVEPFYKKQVHEQS